jgi:hypothetical protein
VRVNASIVDLAADGNIIGDLVNGYVNVFNPPLGAF